MSRAPQTPEDPPTQDPWKAFGYITAGVIIYGLIGFGLDSWFGTHFIVAIGIIIGAVLGIYMTWARFLGPIGPEPHDTTDDLSK